MSEQSNSPWDAVARECPRKIMKLLHEAGHYHHGTTPRYPDRVCCWHKDADLPEGFEPTQAQLDAEGQGEDVV